MFRASANRKVLYALALSAGMHGAAAGLVAAKGAPSPYDGVDGTPTFNERMIAARLGPTADASTHQALQEMHGAAASKAAATNEAVEPGPIRHAGPDSGAALPAVRMPYYHTAPELDQGPRPITAIALEEAAQQLAEGYLILRLLINEAGIVDDVVVVLDDAPPELERSARSVFGRAQYAPGMKNGHAVKSQMMIEVKLERPPL